jgi:ABC-2 type transport system ATP-binding protein
MNIITGYLSATKGDVSINGFDILDDPLKAKKQIGYLPEHPPLYGDMFVDEYLNFVCDIKGVKRSERKQMLKTVTETVRIADMRRRLVKNLSKGYRQRVGLAQALIGFPSVLVLDEPTVGLDPKQIIEMRNVIKNLGKKHTVILSSHILPEVSAVCDRVIIIHKGSLVASGTTERLSQNLTQGHRMNIRIKGEKDAIYGALKTIPELKNVTAVASREKGTYDFDTAGDEGVDIREPIFKCMSQNGMPILLMKSLDLTLEDIFLQVTSGKMSEKETSKEDDE